MIILSILLLVACVFFAFRYFNLRKAIFKLQGNMQKKRQSETNLILTNPIEDKHLAKLIHEINQVFDELQEVKIISNQEKKTLDLAIHNITHDIRTPLTIASGYTQQLLKKSAPEDLPALQKIKENLTVVSERLETLLEYQNLMEANIQPDYEELDFSQYLTEQLLSYYDALNSMDIQVDIAIAPDIFISNDPEILQRILQNLFGNVIKHGKDSLSVELTTEDKYASLILKNVSQQPINSIDRLTTRFYSENMSETEKSSGLGLYVVKELVELTQGYLEMEYQEPWFTMRIYFLKVR